MTDTTGASPHASSPQGRFAGHGACLEVAASLPTLLALSHGGALLLHWLALRVTSAPRLPVPQEEVLLQGSTASPSPALSGAHHSLSPSPGRYGTNADHCTATYNKRKG